MEQHSFTVCVLLKQRGKQAEDILNDSCWNAPVLNILRRDPAAFVEQIGKAIFDIFDAIALIDKYSVFKVMIKTAVIQIDRSYNSKIIIDQ